MKGSGGNFTAKIGSVVIAVFLWFYVITDGMFTTKFTVPIRYVGPSEGYVLASTKPDEATIVLRGTGKELVSFYLVGMFRSDQRYALVNLTGLPEGDSRVTLDPGSFNFGMFSDLNVENILYPDNASFQVMIDRQIKRTVSVNVDSLPEVRVAEGHMLVSAPTARPAFVVIQGPASVIENIDDISIGSIAGRTVTPTDSVLTATLEPPDFVTVLPDEVELVFRAEPVVSRLFTDIPLTLRGFRRRDSVSFRPDSLSIEIRGPRSVVDGMEKKAIALVVDYSLYRDVSAAGDSMIVPTVDAPDGVSVVSISPKTVQFTRPPS